MEKVIVMGEVVKLTYSKMSIKVDLKDSNEDQTVRMIFGNPRMYPMILSDIHPGMTFRMEGQLMHRGKLKNYVFMKGLGFAKVGGMKV